MISVQTVRIYPSPTQQNTLLTWMSRCRRVWNHFLEHRIKAYKRRKQTPTFFDQCKMLTKWRENDDRMREVPLRFQRDALDRLQKAFDAFFRRVKAGEKPGFPRFKGKDRWNSLYCSDDTPAIRAGRIAVPKLSTIRCRNLRPIDGTIKGLRIVNRADRWFAQLLIDDGKEAPSKIPVVDAVGLDVGLTSFIATSDGDEIPAPQEFRRLERKLRRANRSLDHKRKGSRRRLKAKKRLARLHLKIADRRADFTHKLSKVIVQTYDLIAVEDLNVKSMMQGRFAKSIGDAAWSRFVWNLSYKAEWAGKTFVRVCARGTSQQCSQCGEHVPKKLKVRHHDCPKCGLSISRDINAARNVLSRAVGRVAAEFTHGETPTPGTRKGVGARRRTVKSCT